MATTSLAHSGHQPRPDNQEESPHACYDGWGYMGFIEDEGEDEQIERVPCRRCANPENL